MLYKTSQIVHLYSIFIIMLSILHVFLKLLSTLSWTHDVVNAPLRNPLIYSVKSPPPFCLSSVEVKTSDASTLSIYTYISSFSSYCVCSCMLPSLTCPPCHSKILIYIKVFQKFKIYILSSTHSASTMNHFADWRYTMCLLNANFNQKRPPCHCPPCHQAFHDRVDMVHDRGDNCIVFAKFW